MNQTTILFDASTERWPELTAALEAEGFLVLRCRSISELENLGPGKDRGAIILDLDNALLNNRVLREVKRRRPAMQLLGISNRPFHPELKDAIANYIYACLREPVDLDELIYLVKSTFSTATSSEDGPVHNE